MTFPGLPSNGLYEGLRFSFADMDREIENLRKLAQPFLSVESFTWILIKWKEELATFRNQSAGQTLTWEISQDHPIETNLSDGEYELKPKKGGLKVFGRISSKWQLNLPVNEVKKRGAPSESFVLDGPASTLITIWTNDEPQKEIARWTIEIGDASSPGCHFHTQIDLDHGDNKFPKALCVPRFPGILHTPMDALEFLLSELFQDRWLEVASQGKDSVKTWANCQRTRLINLLDWQKDKLRDTTGSPWTMLKKEKPTLDMLMRPL